jgi:fructokinase
MHTADTSPRPIVFGELLFDQFPDGQQVPGGAPFNVCWHLVGFGQAPLLISAVGDDEPGQRIQRLMTHWGMDLSGIQTVAQATGEVLVGIDDQGEPGYRIAPAQAWDHIDADTAQALVREVPVPLFCHGTLALREHGSRIALETLRDGLGLPTLVDVNLRPPWWQTEVLMQSLTQATWAKLNDDELRRACAAEGLPDGNRVTMAKNLRARHGLELLLITVGADGALLVSSNAIVHEPAVKVSALVDTVGAGDAFTAVLIIGLIEGWSPHTLLRRAAAFAADIVAIRGATCADRGLYQQHLQCWRQGEF